MISETHVLETLDNARNGIYNTFIYLGDPSAYLADARLNIFRNNNDQWAIAAEKLGYNPRADAIILEISYYGNCLVNLEEYNGHQPNYYQIYPVDYDSFDRAHETECVKPGAEFILVRNKPVKLNHNKEDYEKAGIPLRELEPGEIHWSEAARLLVTEHRELFRATDDELYKSIPRELNKILVIDEWYHRDFEVVVQPPISEDQLRNSFASMQNLTGAVNMDFETFKSMVGFEQKVTSSWNTTQWKDNRPSSYETWQLIAKVIATGDPSAYQPTLAPNSHWKNYPDSGSY